VAGELMRVFRNRKAWERAQAENSANHAKREVRRMIEDVVKSDRLPVGDRGHFVQHYDTAADGRRKWMIVDPYGHSHGMHWGLDEAVAACRELIATGQITR
jgi:hypothetical protein